MSGKLKHTPGPWVFDEGKWGVVKRLGIGGISDEHIAKLPDPYDDETRASMIPDGYLLAAAPELLDAARFYVANCPQRGRFNHDQYCDGPMCSTFRAAIAKAEGRS